jgi:hypothetical protein
MKNPTRATRSAARCAGILAAALLLLVVLNLPALSVRNPVVGYTVDLPIGWHDPGNDDPLHIGFLAPNSDAMLQIIALDAATADSGYQLAQYMQSQIGSNGEVAEYEYQGRSTALTDVVFVTNGVQVRGYLLTIDGEHYDYALLAFAAMASYEAAHDHLVSAMDSFSLPGYELYPGPISQLFDPYVPDPDPGDLLQIPFFDHALAQYGTAAMLDATTTTVEREARILEPYGALEREAYSEAWRRYYRMIYRDNYMRLATLAESLDQEIGRDFSREELPYVLLSWLQGFGFDRAGGLSDFAPPIACLASMTGDCDSLAMIYVILLHHFQIDAILMVSDVYSHAMAAVDLAGAGARFPFEGRNWLVAEMTSGVDLGQISADMADPTCWIGVRMRLQAVE